MRVAPSGSPATGLPIAASELLASKQCSGRNGCRPLPGWSWRWPCAVALACPAGGAGLSLAHGEDHRAVRRRRSGRHLRPLPRPAPAGDAQAVVRGREPARRRLDHRHRRGREVGARRLHAADDVQHPHHQRDAAAQQAVPADARLRAGGARQLLRPDHGGAPLGAGQGPQGVPGAAESQAGRPQLRLLRPRHALSHGRRAVQSHERHQHRARAASRQRRRAHRRASAATCR